MQQQGRSYAFPGSLAHIFTPLKIEFETFLQFRHPLPPDERATQTTRCTVFWHNAYTNARLSLDVVLAFIVRTCDLAQHKARVRTSSLR